MKKDSGEPFFPRTQCTGRPWPAGHNDKSTGRHATVAARLRARFALGHPWPEASSVFFNTLLVVQKCVLAFCTTVFFETSRFFSEGYVRGAYVVRIPALRGSGNESRDGSAHLIGYKTKIPAVVHGYTVQTTLEERSTGEL